MNSDNEQIIHPTSVRFAAAKAGDINVGVPSIAIPTIDDPNLQMWKTMEKRVIKADYGMRIEASQDDVFRMLGSIIDACAIGLYTFSATDMDASAETIAEMKTWIRETNLMTAYKGGGINSDDRGALYNYRVHGEYAIWISRNNKTGGTGKITEFINLPVNGLRRMTNPRDPTQFYFFQKYDKVEDWTDPESWDDIDSEKDSAEVKSTEQRVWYITDGESGRDATDEETGDALYPNIKDDDWVLPLENLIYVKNPSPPLNDFTVSAISAKRYLVMMSPAAIQLGIVPFDLLTFGNENLRPPVVDEKIKTTNPTEYDKQVKILDAYTASIQDIVHELYDCSVNGKPFGVQWGVEHKRFEPKMALTADFIETMMFSLNQIIAFSIGIPLTIITSVGTELATSRLTMATTSLALTATQQSFREVITTILKMEFADEMESQGIEIDLQELDNTDQKTKAEIFSLIGQAVNYLSAAGATDKTKAHFLDAASDIPISHAEFGESTAVEVPDDDSAPPEEDIEVDESDEEGDE